MPKRKNRGGRNGTEKHKYPVQLTVEERAELNRITVSGQIAVRKLNRVKILLLADENHVKGKKTDQEIAEKLEIGRATVDRIRRTYAEAGVKAAVNEKPRSGRPAEIDGEQRAKITALACSSAPEGYARWSLRLLAEQAVELEYLDAISYETVREILKKTN